MSNIILGKNIDTIMWIKNLKEMEAEQIIVIDYEHLGSFEEENGVLYMSPVYAKEYIKKFDSVNFYKSLYAYPGMQGKMSSLYKKDKN